MSGEVKLRPVTLKERVPFHCRRCGDCCRQVADSIMLEPHDLFRLGRFLRAQGEPIEGVEDVLEKYAHPSLLEGCFPIFLMNTVGDEDACVFLKEGRCTVYEARPRVCRLYPFTVAPGERGRDFAYFLCLDRPFHLNGGTVVVKDWLRENFPRDVREFLRADNDALPLLGKAIRDMGPERFERKVFRFLFFRYYNYDFDQPFLPQVVSNLKKVKEIVETEAVDA